MTTVLDKGVYDIVMLCDPGCESYAAQEATALLASHDYKGSPRVAKGYVVLSKLPLRLAARFLYESQVASRLLVLLAEGTIRVPEDVIARRDELLHFDYTPFLADGASFKVACERHGKHEFQAREVETALGGLLHEEKGFPVDLRSPDLTVWCTVVEDSFVVGFDLAGRDLGKRSYKAFNTRRSLRATVAAAALVAAGFERGSAEGFLDPFCLDGVIIIEAALSATKTSPHKYTKTFAFTKMPWALDAKILWNDFFAAIDTASTVPTEDSITGFSSALGQVKASRANAKLAGVEKAVMLTKCDVSWVDTKCEAESLAYIVTHPLASGKSTPLKTVEQAHEDLCGQAAFALKTGGRLVVVSGKRAEFLNAAQRHDLTLVHEDELWMGGARLRFLCFEKKPDQ